MAIEQRTFIEQIEFPFDINAQKINCMGVVQTADVIYDTTSQTILYRVGTSRNPMAVQDLLDQISQYQIQATGYPTDIQTAFAAVDLSLMQPATEEMQDAYNNALNP